MRVLHVETGRHLYGGARQVLHLMRGLGDRGVTNYLMCEAGSAIAGEARSLPVTVIELPRAEGPALTRRVRQMVRRERIDLVHLHSRRSADDFGALGARLGGARVVLSRRVDNHQPRALLMLKRPLYDRVIAISRAIRRVLLADGMPRRRLATIPSAIDLTPQLIHDQTIIAHGDAGMIRRVFDLPTDSPVIVMVAQFIERKGHRTLVEAMPRMIEAEPRARFVLFGQGPLREPIEAAVREKGLDAHVVFAGFRSDVTSLLKGADLLVHPAYREGLGIALLEAAAAGVPIVGARAGGVPEIVREGVTGRLVQPGDAEALADAIIALLAVPAQRARFAAASRARVAERFSVDAMVAGNLAVYHQVLG